MRHRITPCPLPAAVSAVRNRRPDQHLLIADCGLRQCPPHPLRWPAPPFLIDFFRMAQRSIDCACSIPISLPFPFFREAMANHVDPFAGKPLIQIAASYNANLSPWPRPVGLTRFNRNLPPRSSPTQQAVRWPPRERFASRRYTSRFPSP
jgi:hypothetical protein